MDDRITALFRACEPSESLAPGDPRYVNADDARGEAIAIKYARSIERADPARPDVKYFAGHLGIGKTSELLRLRKLLEERAFTVVYVDVSRRLDVNDLRFSDLLALIADEALTQLRAAKVPGFDAVSVKFGHLWSEFVTLLGANVTVRDATAETGFGKVAVELKNNPSKRQAIRHAIEGIGTQLLDAINDELDKAVAAIRGQSRSGLVLIVDGLDKVQRREVDAHGKTTHDVLFVDRSTQLASLRAHCVYTIPISLIYSPRQAMLEEAFGEYNPPMPMIRLRPDDKGEVTADTPGMRVMAEMIDRRCEFAKLNRGEAFEPAAVDRLCRASGGHPRHLMAFIQGACNETDRLPITFGDANKSINRYANSLFRQLPHDPDYLAKLKAFDRPRPNFPRDETHWQMLYLLHLFEYMNGQPYYEVNPVFRDLPSYRDA